MLAKQFDASLRLPPALGLTADAIEIWPEDPWSFSVEMVDPVFFLSDRLFAQGRAVQLLWSAALSQRIEESQGRGLFGAVSRLADGVSG